MRSTRPQARRRFGNSGVQWLSFSDLMSALLLIFILIMFYIMYQYFDMLEIKMAEIARQQYDLEQANASLDEKSAKLTEAEKQMLTQQIKLNATEADLASKQEELNKAQSLVSEKEQEIAAQQEKLDALSIQLGTQQTQIDQQQAKLDEQQQQIEALVGMRTRIITSLSSALKTANISAQVDPTNGSIALESDVLFELGRYDLSERGERFIDRFLPVYLDVLFSDEYREYVAEIIIEGHTDSTGSYIDNLELSQRRALAVASYVLDDGYRGITPAQKNQLRVVTTANGRSFSDPVLDEYGNEDMDASRRVVFKFRLTDEQMIEQLKSILEQN
ncbi:MAG: OmpA family protein [Clostridia bacterium]|nr:OmpA family protein [Clostridia bacterium]MBR6891315.1 OmpA family protein [Clostridia bacterium]